MSAFNGLKLVAARRLQTASPIQLRRNKLVTQLWEQIELARASAEGKLLHLFVYATSKTS